MKLSELKSIVKDKFAYHFTAQNDLANIYLIILQKHAGILHLWNDFLQVNTLINNPLLTIKDIKKDSVLIMEIYKNFNYSRFFKDKNGSSKINKNGLWL